MIWYLLYPFRGTTEPPQLDPTHPLYKFFVRYGTATARHWLLSILFSVATAVLLCYPAFFLYDTPTTGLYNLPRHAWTSATPYQGNPNTRADVEMRQIWVHGSFMRALEPVVFREALTIQDAIIGPGFGSASGQVPESTTALDGAAEPLSLKLCPQSPQNDLYWGFHSPLMYWNCSLDALVADRNIVDTINARSTARSFLNFTLRPTSVFAGKSFARDKLVAADALVITLFDRVGFHVQEQWDSRFQQLVKDSPARWSIYPANARAYRSQLYEFRFQPMTLRDDLGLAFAYAFTALYVLVSMRKVRAVKSKVGLIITILSQIAITFLGSFTICSMIPSINLTQIPREMYPFVATILGLENMFRLVNSVLSQPELSTSLRIGRALGQVGPLSLAAAAQNLAFLGLLSRVSYPGAAAFCTFAAVAIVLDFMYHLTFFAAVLSVDVRRMELQESIDKFNQVQTSSKAIDLDRRPKEIIRDICFAFWNKIPFSSRIAGTAVMICFILLMNSHLHDSDASSRSFIFRFLMSPSLNRARTSSADSLFSPPIHQARTPAAWLKMQDHDTAKELIQFAKPNSHSFLGRVYEPVTVVLKGSERRDIEDPYIVLFNTLSKLASDHFFPFALAIVFVIASVTILMNYLIGSELPEDDQFEDRQDEPMLSIRTLGNAHSLDIVKLCPTRHGHLITMSIDRSTALWLLDRPTRTFANILLRTADLNPPFWPIIAATVNREGTALALCNDAGVVAFWNVPEQRFSHFTMLSGHAFSISLFKFVSFRVHDRETLSLVIVTADGRLSQVDFRSGQLRSNQIRSDHVVSACTYPCSKGDSCVAVTFANGDVKIVKLSSEGFTFQSLDSPSLEPTPDVKPPKARCVVALPSLGLLALVRSCQVDLYEINHYRLVHSIHIGPAKPQSVRFLPSARRNCHCEAPAIQSISVVYTNQETQDCIMHTYSTKDSKSSLICLRPHQESTSNCHGLRSAHETVHILENPGVWEATGSQAIAGIRKRASALTPTSSPAISDASSYFSSSASHETSSNHLKHRNIKDPTPIRTRSDTLSSSRRPENLDSFDSDSWEAWALTHTGELFTRPLFKSSVETRRRQNSDSDIHIHEPSDALPLFVARPGPVAKLGRRSIAVVLGNIVKVITFAESGFSDEETEEALDIALVATNRRRRAGGKKAQ